MARKTDETTRLKQELERLQNYVAHLHDYLERTEDPDQVLLFSRPFNDLSGSKFRKILQNPKFHVQIVDVSQKSSDMKSMLPEYKHIPLKDLSSRWSEIRNDVPVVILSEDGLESLRACDFLTRQGLININHLRGGHGALKELFVH